MAVSSQKRNNMNENSLRSKKQELIKSLSQVGVKLDDIVHSDSKKSFYSAYKVKADLIKTLPKPELSPPKIATLEPLKVSSPGKFSHCASAIISPLSRKVTCRNVENF